MTKEQEKKMSQLIRPLVEKIIKKQKLSENTYPLSKPMSSSQIVKLLNAECGEEFKADWTGATDKFGPIKDAKITKINRGNGFEEAVMVTSGQKDTMIYIGPFVLGNLPTKDTMLIFSCDDAIYIEL